MRHLWVCQVVLGIVLAGTATIAPVHATVDRTRVALAQKAVPRLSDWITSKTGWEARNPPTVLFKPPRRLNKMYFGRADGKNGATVTALYDRRTQAIYLSNAWNPNDARAQSYLVHELVHYLQFTNHVEVPCNNAYDLEAYHLQFDWLSEHGIRHPQTFLGIDDVFLFSATRCPIYRGCDFLPEGCRDRH
jgi:hypothetical protein